jgi:hypothetical protein
MAGDTICRLGSTSKPIVAACAMTLVEDCTLRLDNPVDELLPELTDMTVLAAPNGPLDDTVAAIRPITLRDLLAYTLGTGMVPAEPGTVPIADALNALGKPAPDEWMRRLGALPLVHQPGERWTRRCCAPPATNVNGHEPRSAPDDPQRACWVERSPGCFRAPGSVVVQDIPDPCLKTRRIDVSRDPGLGDRGLRACVHVSCPFADHRRGGRKQTCPRSRRNLWRVQVLAL